MDDRDTFAAAALTGLIANDAIVDVPERAYKIADAMLRQRGTAVSDNCVAGNKPEIPCPVTEPMPKEKRAEVSDTNHDAAPAAKANAESVAPQPTAGDRSGNPTSHSGTGDSLSEAEIDALQHVVEDGRIVKMQDYGALRSLLVRLRPEWEYEDDSDRPKPISDNCVADNQPEIPCTVTEPEVSDTNHDAAPAAKARTDADRNRTDKAALRPGEGTGDSPEPVAWALVYPNDEVAVIAFRRQDAAELASASDRIVPLYRQPQPTLTDAEREALSWFTGGRGPVCPQHLATIRGLMARLS